NTATPPVGAGKATFFDFVKKSNQQPSVYLKYEMKDVVISSFSTAPNAGEDPIPFDPFTLKFKAIVFSDEHRVTEAFVPAKNDSFIGTENDETHWVGHDRLTGRDETVMISVSRTE